MMRSINTLEWHAGQEGFSLNNGMFVRALKSALQLLLYVPLQFNRYLDRLDESPAEYSQRVLHANRQSLQSGRHQHIPARVWRRRSALLVLMDDNRTVAAHSVPANHSV